MTDPTRALLPSGFYDLLPPDAAFEAHLVYHCMQNFLKFGYERVKPPLVEFEDSLLASASETIDKNTFRMLDPLSQRMLGLRADTTMQIGRIALTRMKDAPRPLRLCYSGTTLNTKASALFPSRQHVQAGAELIGVDTANSDAEAMIIAIQGLKKVGVKRISIDLNLPKLAADILETLELDEDERQHMLKSLAQKDVGPLGNLPDAAKEKLTRLADMFGTAKEVLPQMQALDLNEKGKGLTSRLATIITQLERAHPDVQITIDATENRGYDYHGGVSFALFASGIEGEIGRGGRYRIAYDRSTSAIGSTIYISRLLPILTPPAGRPRVYLQASTSIQTMQELHEAGYATICATDERNDSDEGMLRQEAERLRCGFYRFNDEIRDV